MTVCKHGKGCDVSGLRVLFKNYFLKAIEHFFRVYRASEGWVNSQSYANPRRSLGLGQHFQDPFLFRQFCH